MPKKRGRYGDYTETINGVLYASVNIPLGNGKYKKRRKKVSTKTEARQWAESQLNRGYEVETNLSFSAIAEWYKEHYLIPPVYENKIRIAGFKDWKKQRGRLDRIALFFGARPVDSITEHDLRFFARERREKDGVGITSTNRDFALLKTMYRKAQGANKLQKVPSFPINIAAERSRDRVLSFGEELRLLDACINERAYLRDVIIIALDTGMRKGEIFSLTWGDIDFLTDTITIQFFNSKTQKSRKIGMTPRVRIILRGLFEVSNQAGKIFPIADPKKAFGTACRLAGIEDLHFHDLRHTATTRMVRAGIPHTEVMKITGHTQIKTFLRYLNLVDATAANAAAQLGRFLEGQAIQENDTLQ